MYRRHRKAKTSVFQMVMLMTWAVARPAHADEDGQSSIEHSNGPKYPSEISLRPLVLPSGMNQGQVYGGYWWLEGVDNTAVASTVVQAGITDRWEVAVYSDYRLDPNPAWRRQVALSTRYLAYDSKEIDVTAGLSVPIDLSRDSDTDRMVGITLDAPVRFYYKKLAFYLGDGLIPVGIAQPSVGITVNGAMVAQARSYLAMRLSMRVAHINVYGDDRESVFLEGPLAADVILSPISRLDIIVSYQNGPGTHGLSAGLAIRI